MTASDADRAFAQFRTHGRPADLARVFDQCAPQLLLLGHHVDGARGAAEDLVQATFLTAIEQADRFQPGRPVLPWLMGILVREAKQQRRKAGRSPDRDRLAAPGDAKVPLDEAAAREFQEALTAALAELPAPYREVLTLKLVHGLSATEIAHARGAPPETVRTQLKRGAERLRALLPAGFASVVAAAVSAPALAQVRAVVLQAAAPAAAAAAGMAAAGGAAAIVSVTKAAGTGLARKVLWSVGLATAAGVTVLVVATDPGEPVLPPAIRRQVVTEEAVQPAPVRTTAPAEVAATPEPEVEGDRATAVFLGRVCDENGIGRRATVELVRLHTDALLAPTGDESGMPPLHLATTTTDAMGRFRFDDVQPSGVFLLGVDAWQRGIRWRFVDRTPEPRQEVDLGDVTAPRPRLIRGRVLDDRGRPVRGARVASAAPRQPPATLGLLGPALAALGDDDFARAQAVATRWNGGEHVLTIPPWVHVWAERLRAPVVETDQRGRFVWPSERAGSVRLVLLAEGYAPRRVQARPTRATEELSFELRPERNENKLAGTVVDDRGARVAGAQVLVGRPTGEPWFTARAVATADEHGAFVVPRAKGQRLTVLARPRPGQPWRAVEVAPDERRCTVRLAPRHALQVKVGARSGETVAGPALRLLPDPGAGGANGSGFGVLALYRLGCLEPLDTAVRVPKTAGAAHEIQDVPRGDWLLLASAEGHVDRTLAVQVYGREHVRLPLDPTTETELLVEDRRGQPLADVAVYAPAPADDAHRAHELARLLGRTGGDGVLRLERNARTRVALAAASPQLGDHTATWANLRGKIALRAGGRARVQGRLLGAEGQAGAWLVQAVPAAEDGEPPPAFGVPRQAGIDDEGRFVLPDLELGTWQVRVVPLTGPLCTHAVGLWPVLFPEPEPRLTQTVALQSLGRTKLLFDVTPPPPVTEVAAAPSHPKTLHGTLLVRGAPTGVVQLVAERDGRWQRIGVDAETGAFDAGFPHDRDTRVLLLPQGAPLPDAGETPDEYLWLREVAKPADPVPTAIGFGLSPFSAALEPDRGVQGKADIPLLLTGAVAGPGEPPARTRQRARSDRSGWFALDYMAQGTYSIRGEHPELGWVAEDDVAVDPAQATVGVPLRLRGLVAAAGTVDTKVVGALRRGSEVEFVRTGGGPSEVERTVMLRAGAHFQVGKLLPGSYRVTIYPAVDDGRGGSYVPPRSQGLALPQGEIEVGGGGRQGIVLGQRRK